MAGQRRPRSGGCCRKRSRKVRLGKGRSRCRTTSPWRWRFLKSPSQASVLISRNRKLEVSVVYARVYLCRAFLFLPFMSCAVARSDRQTELAQHRARLQTPPRSITHTSHSRSSYEACRLFVISRAALGDMPELYNDLYDEFFLAPVTQEDVGTTVDTDPTLPLKRQFQAASGDHAYKFAALEELLQKVKVERGNQYTKVVKPSITFVENYLLDPRKENLPLGKSPHPLACPRAMSIWLTRSHFQLSSMGIWERTSYWPSCIMRPELSLTNSPTTLFIR